MHSKNSSDNSLHWQRYVNDIVELFEKGRGRKNELKEPRITLPVRPAAPCRRTVLLCSPHPDDEVLTGGLPLRLLKENNCDVVNIAITLGSLKSRRRERKKELMNACNVLGFSHRMVTEPLGFEPMATKALKEDQQALQVRTAVLVNLLVQYNPVFVFYPHPGDLHPTHEGTSFLIDEALKQYSADFGKRIHAMETEFWFPQRKPNVLVGLTPEDVAGLVHALSLHRGEVSRNPYHLFLPARLMDNVRRSMELFSGFGGEGSSFLFGELYRWSIFEHGSQQTVPEKHIFPPHEHICIK